MMSRRFCLAAGLGIIAAANAWAARVEGRVFLDVNGNARADAGEPGVAQVSVSDGVRVTVTDTAGGYRLETAGASGPVWICVPRDHLASGPFWRAADGTRREDFGLLPRKQQNDFLFVQITDTHLGRFDLFGQFRENLHRFPVPVMFIVNTGDLVGGLDGVPPEKVQPQYYAKYLEAIPAFRMPFFNIPGNHEHVAISLKGSDQNHPFYGKGLYRKVFGPTHYSWDWAEVHFVALDGTSVPYQEQLGTSQLAWLAADLKVQPADKPLVLFCHESIPSLRDAKELAKILQGRCVLGAFCGHLHETFTTKLGNVPVYLSGALSGSWWSGPNIDGSPQGFRLAQIKSGALKTLYTNREGLCPVSLVAPLSTTIKSGTIEVDVSVLDFGSPVEMSATYGAGNPIALKPVSREELWSVWRGTVDTRQAFDGARTLTVTAKQGEVSSVFGIRYLVINGRTEAYAADAAATVRMQVKGINAPDTLLFNGKPLGVVPADTTNATTLAFEISKERLARCNRLTVRAAAYGKGTDLFSFGPVWLEHKGKKIYDFRYVSFNPHTIGGNDPTRREKELYYCLP